MMKKFVALFALCIGVSVFYGCSSVTSVAVQPDDADPSVVFENRSYSNQLVFLEIEDLKHRTVGNLMQAQASVRNTSSFQIEFKYQFRFFDKDGFWVDEDSRPWTSVTLQGKDNKQIKAVAPNPSATAVKIFIQK